MRWLLIGALIAAKRQQTSSPLGATRRDSGLPCAHEKAANHSGLTARFRIMALRLEGYGHALYDGLSAEVYGADVM